MTDTPSITINHRMTYKGQPEIWSNKYHFSGPTPTDAAGWQALYIAIKQATWAFLQPSVKFAGYLGHEAGNEFAVVNRDFVAEGATLDGGLAGADADPTPGDAAVWVRWRTPSRTSRGKTIYLRKYFHGIAASGDTIPSDVKTEMLSYANKMINGTLPGGVKICGPQGAVASAPSVAPFVGFRQLKRTGKRPSR